MALAKKSAMKSAMKAMKTMKAMKVMKTKRVSKVAKGSHAKAMVFRGSKVKTSGGLKKDGLTKNKHGKVVSKKASANGRRAFQHIRRWNQCVVKARKELNIKGFCAVNGRGQGKALYAKAKALYNA